MKMLVLFECEYCGKQSLNRDEIENCEAIHLGLTHKEYHSYQTMKLYAELMSDAQYTSCKKRAKDSYKEAVENLALFEKKHNITEGKIKALKSSQP